MRTINRPPTLVVLAVFVASLLAVITPREASASESVPPLQYERVDVGSYSANSDVVTSPAGTVTIPCSWSNGGRDLKTYSATGQLIQHIPRSPSVDGIENCIVFPAVDKNGTVYGILGSSLLVAYEANTVKWKYPVACGNTTPSYVVGATGNIYVTKRLGNGDVRLVGLAPNLAPGQTEPATVVDIDIPNDCTIQLTAYKDGIVAHGQQSGNAHYYSYGGKYLGQASLGDMWYEKVNADGRLFVPKVVSGSVNSLNISIYDPRTGSVVWTTQASTEGAHSSTYSLSPLAGGGVAALVKEHRMVSPGIPASPVEWVSTFVVINAAGNKVKSLQLPNYDPTNPNNHFDRTYLNADSSGKVIVTRELYMDTQVSWPSAVPAITIGVYNPATDTWVYQNTLKGDVDNPSRPYGYQHEAASLDGGAKPSANTLNIVAYCRHYCPNNDYNRKLFPVRVDGIGVDYPRGVVLARTQRELVSYLALGDSFSSAEGVEPFEADTAIQGLNLCHRSEVAYAKLLVQEHGLPPLGPDGFRACSGALTTHITDLEQWNESIQLDLWPDSSTKIVTLTIGGNDIGFSDFARACVLTTCDTGTSPYNASLTKINDLGEKLKTTYRRILQYTPNAKIYVGGYPQVIDYKSITDPHSDYCFYMEDGHSRWGDARAAREIVQMLNETIHRAVEAVQSEAIGNSRLRYVQIDGSDSPFVGHEICGSSATSWFQNLDQSLNNAAYVFHPNVRGHEGYASMFGAAIHSNQ